jgi:hypothetical protein
MANEAFFQLVVVPSADQAEYFVPDLCDQTDFLYGAVLIYRRLIQVVEFHVISDRR